MAHRTASRLPPRDILSRAAAILAAQPSVPPSPGQAVDGRLLLCAGAALAAAGLDAADPARRAAFNAGVAGADGMGVLYGAIGSLGWDEDFCHGMIRDNDRTPLSERKAAMLARLRAAMADAPA
jgi:hypothetical protein